MLNDIKIKNTLTVEIVVLMLILCLSFFLPFNNFTLYGSLIFLFILFSIIARFRKISLTKLGFVNIPKAFALPWIIITATLLFVILLTKYFYPDGIFIGILKNRHDFIYIIPAYVLVGSFAQEYIFRGYFFARVRNIMNEKLAIFSNIIIFSLFHLPYLIHLHSYFFYLSIIGGIFWSIFYAKYPNMYMAWFSHAVIGSCALLLLQRF